MCLECGIREININHTNTVTAYLGLGANLGERLQTLETALCELDDLPIITVTKVSSVYETRPVGVIDQPVFLNMAAQVQTSLAPSALLTTLLNLENKLGRMRTFRWGPRVIDIDLLLYGNQEITQPGLTVPHPRLRERAFVVVPLAEIAPDLTLPGDGQAISALAEILSRDGNILYRKGV